MAVDENRRRRESTHPPRLRNRVASIIHLRNRSAHIDARIGRTEDPTVLHHHEQIQVKLAEEPTNIYAAGLRQGAGQQLADPLGFDQSPSLLLVTQAVAPADCPGEDPCLNRQQSHQRGDEAVSDPG